MTQAQATPAGQVMAYEDAIIDLINVVTDLDAADALDKAVPEVMRHVEAIIAKFGRDITPDTRSADVPVEERKFYRKDWSLAQLLEARDRGLLTDDGEAWRYRYTHKDATGEYDLLYRPTPKSQPPQTADTDAIAVQSEAADLLRHYADYIRTVKADELERHPYLPLIEQVIESLTALSPTHTVSDIGVDAMRAVLNVSDAALEADIASLDKPDTQGGRVPDRFANDAAAKALYDSWSDQPGWVPWVERGNSDMQEKARRDVIGTLTAVDDGLGNDWFGDQDRARTVLNQESR